MANDSQCEQFCGCRRNVVSWCLRSGYTRSFCYLINECEETVTQKSAATRPVKSVSPIWETVTLFDSLVRTSFLIFDFDEFSLADLCTRCTDVPNGLCPQIQNDLVSCAM